jgi:hypothetical protein
MMAQGAKNGGKAYASRYEINDTGLCRAHYEIQYSIYEDDRGGRYPNAVKKVYPLLCLKVLAPS